METRKLYYENCHLRQFAATVTGCEKTDKGWQITLDQTAFYPEGGGQACDLGTLGDARVLDVREQGADIIHLCDRELTPGSTVQGSVDWARRFDLMQQHAGEHILSGLIFEKFGYHNSGFHVGAEVMEVDFDGPVPADDLKELEEKANQVVWANLPILCGYPSQEELSNMTYRTKRELPWPVRIVEIPGVDRCACCGVHTATTGEVGFIKILSCVKFHSGVRLELVCGGRAYKYMRHIFDQNRQVSQLLSAKMPETAGAVQKLQDAYEAEKSRAIGLQKQIFGSIAAGCQGQENVLRFEKDLTGGAVRELADRIAEACTGIAAVLSGSDQAGYSICLVSKSKNVKTLGTEAVQALCGRGGGKEQAFQGTVKATQEQIRDFFVNNANFYM